MGRDKLLKRPSLSKSLRYIADRPRLCVVVDLWLLSSLVADDVFNGAGVSESFHPNSLTISSSHWEDVQVRNSKKSLRDTLYRFDLLNVAVLKTARTFRPPQSARHMNQVGRGNNEPLVVHVECCSC